MTTTDSTPAIGRPRAFDHDAVLSAVVDLFWERGYGATSIGDIVERTGLSKSSLYGAFGSKDELYQTALARYLDDHRSMVATSLLDGQRGLDDIDAFFDPVRAQAEVVGQRRGCLAVNTATELRSSDPAVTDLGVAHRQFLRDGFVAALERAVELGEIDEDRVTDLANLLVGTALGVAVMVRGGATEGELLAHLDSIRRAIRPT